MEEETKTSGVTRLLWSMALGLGLAVGVLLACALRPCLGQAASPPGVAPSDVWVNKSAPVGNIVPGDEYRYVINYGNDASNPATDIVITDTLPEYVTYVRDTSGVTLTVDPGSRTLVWHLGMLGEQQAGTFELWVKLDASMPQETRLRNRVEISDPADPNSHNNESETDVWPGSPYVNLWADKSFRADRPPFIGEVMVCQIRYGNNGNRTAHNVVLTDTLPAGTTVVSTTFEMGMDGLAEHVGDGVVAWEIGTLDAGESREFELAMRIDRGTASGTLLTNEVAISSDDDESRDDDNRRQRITIVRLRAADLRVDQTVERDPSIENGIIYRLSYHNDGMLAAQNVIVTDTLPVSVTHLWHSDEPAATLVDGAIVWRLGALQPISGGQLVVGAQVSGMIPAGAVFTNTVEASTSTPESNYDDNLAVATLGSPWVTCVPWAGGLPHRVWSGRTTTLKGTAKGDGLTSFEWNPGDGSPAKTGTVNDPYAIEARHTYSAALGTVFTATLTVQDTFGWSDTDTYVVQVFSPTHGIRVDAAVDEALWYIHKAALRSERGGLLFAEWASTGNGVADVASAVQAFQVQGHLAGGDPWEDPYVEDVQHGWNALFTHARPYTITWQPAGNPDGDGDGIGIGIYANDDHAIYESGLAMMALASTGAPDQVARTGPPGYVRGQTYYSITQDMADWFAWGQNDAGSGAARGGWCYGPNSGYSDNSNTQFPVLGLAAAEHNWGITVPKWVKNELRDRWLAYTQGGSGGFGYGGPDDHVNVCKTGAGIMDLTWTGVPATDARIVRASSFIEQHWDDRPDGDWNGNAGEFYAMYAVKKGSQLAGIHQYGSHVWDNEYAAYLVRVQKPDGRFDDAGNMGGWQPMNTAWGVLILSPGLYQALPVPVISPLLYGGEGPQWAEVQFDASDSYHTDPNRTTAFFEWNFGDSSPVVTATSSITTHTYPTRGTYLALLTVWDDAGNYAIGASQVNITGPGYHPPVADAGGPYSGRAGQEIALDGSGSYDPDEWMGDSVVLYEWSVAGSGFYTTSAPTLAFSGTVAGTFPVALRVQDRGAGDGPDMPQWSELATTTLTVVEEATPEPTLTPTAVRPTPTATPEPPLGLLGKWPILALVGASLVVIVVVFLLAVRTVKRPRA